MKRGAVILHWVLLGLVVAFGFFLSEINANKGGTGELPRPGAVSLNFLLEGALPVEFTVTEQAVQQAAAVQETLQDLAAHGGAASLRPWNTGKDLVPWDLHQEMETAVQRTYPDAWMEVDQLLLPDVAEKQWKQNFYPYAKSSYRREITHRFDLRSFFQQFIKLRLESQQIITSCANQRDLQTCQLPSGWSFCEPPQTREALFCIPWENYPFKVLLDLQPERPFPVEELQGELQAEALELHFPEEGGADRYIVYATDYVSITQQGEVDEVRNSLFSGYDWQSWFFLAGEIRDEPAACASGMREQKQPYRCGGELWYDIPLTTFSSAFAATVTVEKVGKESLIQKWVTSRVSTS